VILQSTQSVQELLPRPQVAPTSTSTSTQASAETPFRDLLDGALQSRTEPPKAKDAAAQPKETVKSSDKEQPVQDAATGKEPKPAGKARTPASEEDDAQEVAIAAAAAILAPLAVPVQEPVQAQTSATAAQQTIQPSTSLMATPLEQPAPVTTSISLTATPSPVTIPASTAELTLPVSGPEQATSQGEMPLALSANTTMEAANLLPEETPPAATAETQMPKSGSENSQQRLDSLIAKASQELSNRTVHVEQANALAQESPKESAPSAALKLEETAVPKPQPEAKKSDQPTPEEMQLGTRELPTVQIRGMEAEVIKPMMQPTPVQQVEAQVIQHLEQGKTEFRMQLTPKELGKVDVHMLLEDGKLTVQIVTATSKAAQELQRTSESLMASLRMAGTQVESVQIVHRPEETSQQMDGAFNMESGQQQSGQSHHGNSPRHPGQEADWEETSYPTPETLSRLLDEAV